MKTTTLTAAVLAAAHLLGGARAAELSQRRALTLDGAQRAIAAAVAQGYEPELRERVSSLRSSQVPVPWVVCSPVYCWACLSSRCSSSFSNTCRKKCLVNQPRQRLRLLIIWRSKLVGG